MARLESVRAPDIGQSIRAARLAAHLDAVRAALLESIRAPALVPALESPPPLDVQVAEAQPTPASGDEKAVEVRVHLPADRQAW